MRNAAAEAIDGSGYDKDIVAAFDSTSQKRGHTSLNRVLTVTLFDTRNVLAFNCFSKLDGRTQGVQS